MQFSIFFFQMIAGNKGAVGISFLFNGTSMGFVNCHLTSGSEKALRYAPTPIAKHLINTLTVVVANFPAY